MLILLLFAEDKSLDVQNFKLGHSLDLLTLEEALNPVSRYGQKGSLLLGLGVNYANSPFVVLDGNKQVVQKYFVKDILGIDLHLGYRFKKRYFIGLSGDFRRVTLGEGATDKEPAVWTFADPKLLLKARLTSNEARYAVALALFGTYPLGDPYYYATDVGPTIGLSLLADYYMDNKLFFATNVGAVYAHKAQIPQYKTTTSTVTGMDMRVKGVGGLGLGYLFHENFSLHTEFSGMMALPDLALHKALDGMLYARLFFKGFALYLGGALRSLEFLKKQDNQEGVDGSAGEFKYRLFAALRYAYLAEEKEEAPKEVLPEEPLPLPEEPMLLSTGEPIEVIEEAPVIIPVGSKIGTVYFEWNSSHLTQETKKQLDEFSERIRNQYKEKSLKISGHTDGRGSKRTNEKLSKKRAENVKNYLMNKGLTNEMKIESHKIPLRIEIEIPGQEETFKMNRRVEIYVE